MPQRSTIVNNNSRTTWALLALCAGLIVTPGRVLSDAPRTHDRASREDRVPPSAEPLTLRRALALAAQHSPVLDAAGARLGQAAARARAARRYPHNPELETEVASRRGDDGSRAVDFEVGVAQRVSLAGQRRRTRRARSTSCTSAPTGRSR